MTPVKNLGPLCLVGWLAACGSATSGKQTAAALVRIDPEPAGANCPAGGSAVKTGTDTNGDGTLEDDEVTDTAYVCNGASGPSGPSGSPGPSGVSGSSGATALVRVEDEPAGANCPYGGKRIDSGVDTNGDGVLQDGEVTATTYLCDMAPQPMVFYGDVTIARQADLDKLQSYQVVVGNLTVGPSFGGAFSWPALTTVTGNLSIDGAPLTSVSLPLLAATRRLDINSDPNLTSVSVPLLASAPRIYIHDNAQLPLCSALAVVVAGVKTGVTSDWQLQNNDESVACPPDAYCVSTTFTNVPGTVRLCVQALSWSDAETFCESFGANTRLATFSSDADWLAFSAGKVAAFPQLGGWFGYTDAAVEGTWVAVDPSAGFVPSVDDATFWQKSTGEPNGGTSENCTGFYQNGLVNDAGCSGQYNFWCRTP
jgi:hypothetical protein